MRPSVAQGVGITTAVSARIDSCGVSERRDDDEQGDTYVRTDDVQTMAVFIKARNWMLVLVQCE